MQDTQAISELEAILNILSSSEAVVTQFDTDHYLFYKMLIGYLSHFATRDYLREPIKWQVENFSFFI